MAFRFHGTDVKIGVLERGKSIGKETSKRGPVDLGNILAPKSKANNERKMLEQGRSLQDLGNREKGATNEVVVRILWTFKRAGIRANAKSLKALKAREVDLDRCSIKYQRYCTIA